MGESNSKNSNGWCCSDTANDDSKNEAIMSIKIITSNTNSTKDENIIGQDRELSVDETSIDQKLNIDVVEFECSEFSRKTIQNLNNDINKAEVINPHAPDSLSSVPYNDLNGEIEKSIKLVQKIVQDNDLYKDFDKKMYKSDFPLLGPYKEKNGGIYLGQYCKGIKNGEGIYILENGDIYQGYFNAGKPEIQGILIEGKTIEGKESWYYGQFKNGMKNGKGIEKWISGDYSGDLFEVIFLK